MAPAARVARAGVAAAGSGTVVVSMAVHYQLYVHRLFLRSLREHYAGDVVLFVEDNLPPDVARECAERRVTLRRDALAGLRGNRSVSFGGVEIGGFGVGRSKAFQTGLRFLVYAQVCHEAGSDGVPYRWCLATDFRDVVFQGNPFAIRWRGVGRASCGRGSASALGRRSNCDADLLLPTEHPSARFGPGRTMNGKWVAECGSEKWRLAFHEAGHPVICSGVLLGTPTGYAALARLFVRYSKQCGRRPSPGFDQGFLNYAVYGNRFEEETEAGLRVQPHGAGAVMTLTKAQSSLDASAPRDERYPMGANGVVTNYDGSVPPVVHQYDRMIPYGDARMPAAVLRHASGRHVEEHNGTRGKGISYGLSMMAGKAMHSWFGATREKLAAEGRGGGRRSRR